MPDWKKIFKVIGKGAEIALPIAADFGVPGAKTATQAVNMIQGDDALNNDSAVQLVAVQVDTMDIRLRRIEKKLGIKSTE